MHIKRMPCIYADIHINITIYVYIIRFGFNNLVIIEAELIEKLLYIYIYIYIITFNNVK